MMMIAVREVEEDCSACSNSQVPKGTAESLGIEGAVLRRDGYIGGSTSQFVEGSTRELASINEAIKFGQPFLGLVGVLAWQDCKQTGAPFVHRDKFKFPLRTSGRLKTPQQSVQVGILHSSDPLQMWQIRIDPLVENVAESLKQRGNFLSILGRENLILRIQIEYDFEVTLEGLAHFDVERSKAVLSPRCSSRFSIFRGSNTMALLTQPIEQSPLCAFTNAAPGRHYPGVSNDPTTRIPDGRPPGEMVEVERG